MKTMRQPRKDVLREQLALAASEIIELRFMVAALSIPPPTYSTWTERLSWRARKWWRRLLAWVGA